MNANEEMYRRIVRAVPEGIWVVNPQGRTIFCNERMAELLGTDVESLQRLSCFDPVFPADLEEAQRQFGLQIAGGCPPFDFRLRRIDGSLLWVSISCRPIYDNGGVCIGLLGLFTEISERRRAEKELRDSEELFRAIFSQAAVGITQFGVTGEWLLLNDRFCEIVGYTRAELRGKTAFDITHTDDREICVAEVNRILAGEIPSYSAENRYIRKDGAVIWVRLCVTPVWDADKRLQYFIGVVEDITEKIDAERARQDSDQRLTLAQSAARLGLWDHDLRTGVTVTSEEYARLRGLQPGDRRLTHEEWLRLIHPDDRERIQAALRETIERTHVWDTEFRVVWPDGSVHWLFAKGQVFHDDAGRPVRLAGVSLDITERKRAEAVLRESEERFRNMADTAPVMIWVAGPDKGCTFFNKGWLGFTGQTIQRALGNGWVESVHPDDVNRCLDTYSAAFDARRSVQLEARLRRADGEYRWVLCTGVPRFALDGVFAGYIGCCTDITEVKRAEQEVVVNQALRKSEEKYHGIVETMTEGVWILDRDGRTAFVNRQMAAMLGYSVDEMLGRDVLDFKDEEARPIALQKLERRRQGIAEQYDSTFQTRDGDRLTVLISTRPLWEGDGRYAGTLGIITNITERSLLEERLHQAHKMEAIGRLAGGIAHDFNNLLTVINGYSSLLLQNLGAGDRIHAQLTEIRSAGQRAQELTSQMLAFSRNQNRTTGVLSLRSVIEDVEKMLRRMIGENIELMTTFEPGVGDIRADRTEITQVLLNLAVNARDAMPTGGTLTFALSNVEVDENDARRHPGARPGTHVLLTVTDTGIGMDAKIQTHLFEPFFTTKPAGKGTGLGLATVYGIVSQGGGWIQVESKPRQGATFRVYWPSVTGVPSEERDHARRPDQPLCGTETILVVEDQPQVRQLTCTILREFGYQILEASNGEEALRLAETHRGPLDLLLTDVIMPGMHGLELAATLKTMRSTPILLVSGYPESMEAVHDSGLAFIQKPFTPDALVRKVREALGTVDTMRRENTVE